MKISRLKKSIFAASLGITLGLANTSNADPLLNFPFNEGTGTTTTDTVNGLVGFFGTVAQDPAVDKVELVDASPSGQPNDRSIETFGGGFLMAEDATRRLNITNGPITIETWIFIDPNTAARAAEGIIAYGNSYKMGLRSGLPVFTLYGIVDISTDTPLPVGEWVHFASAWEPGAGVHFYVNGTETFVTNTSPRSRPTFHNYLSLGSEGTGNNLIARFDRMRVHHGLLTAAELDSVAATPKAPLANTLVDYQFNQAAFPATNSVAPAMPTILSHVAIPTLTGPKWTTDTPSGAANDFAVSFMATNAPVKEFITVNYGDAVIDLGANNTNYTIQAWIKMPVEPLEERRVILRTDGPGPRISLSINANRTLHTTVLGTADFTTSVPFPNDERWHHVAIVMENFARLNFYLDGVLRNTQNRTQTGAASAGGTARLLIGKESETRYFRGVLDRVIINNNALTAAELDYPARPGLPNFAALASHPTNVLAAAGSTVTFNATPTGATGQQWYFRSNVWDVVGRPVAGQTGTSLTLSNVTTANEGYYYLVVTNTAGEIASHAARLTLDSRFDTRSIGFETPDYISGPVEDQDLWTTDFNGNAVRVLTAAQISQFLADTGLGTNQPVHSGNQALVFSGPLLATTSIRRFEGFESESKVAVDFWIRPLNPGVSGLLLTNTFITLENNAGTRAAGVRLGPNNSFDWGTAITGNWQASGRVWETNTWYNVRFEVDYTAKTYDFFINGTKVNTAPIAFYTSTADRFTQIRIFRGLNQIGGILDDLTISVPGQVVAPEISVRRQADTLTIAWPASATGFTLQGTEKLVPANWTTVTHTTVGAENQASVPITGTSRFFRLIKTN